MSAFFTLLRLQLRLRLSGLMPGRWLPGKLNSLREWRPLLLGFVIFGSLASLEVLVLVMANGILSSFIQMNIPDLLLSIVILICMALSLMVGFFHVTSVLFFSRDSAFLAGLPITSRAAMASRLMVVLLGEIGLTAFVFLPVSILFGVRTGQGVLFYLRAAFTTLLIPCLPLAVAALLSCLLIRVTSLFKHRDRWAVIGGFLLVGLAIPLQMRFYSFIPQDAGADFFFRVITDNRAVLEGLLGGLPPVLWATAAITGQGQWGLLSFALFLLASLAAMALPVLVAGRGYLRLSILQSEAFQTARRKKIRSRDFSGVRSPVMAIFFREWREVLRVPVYALNGLIGIVMMPLMLAAFFLGSEGSNEISQILGQVLRFAKGEMIMLVGAAAMAVVSAVNMAGATAVSREGKHISFSRMIPTPYAKQLMGKQLFGFSINLLTCLTTAVALAVLMPSQILYIAGAFVMGALFGFASNAFSLALDASFPKLHWRNETEAIKQNPISMLSMLVNTGIAALLGFLVYTAWRAGLSLGAVSWVLAALLCLLAIGAYLLLSLRAEKWYARIEM